MSSPQHSSNKSADVGEQTIRLRVRRCPCLFLMVVKSRDYLHFQNHKKPNTCVRCKWGKHKSAWGPKLHMICGSVIGVVARADYAATAASKASWVRVMKHEQDGVYEFRCGICPSFTSRCVDFYLLRRHHQSKSHRRQVMNHLGLTVGPTGVPTATAPSAEEFINVWKAASKGSLHVNGMQSCKVAQLQTCIMKALREKDRAFVRKATTLVLLRDESKGRVLVRARAATASLESRAFVVGMRKYTEGSDFLDITDTSAELVDNFCDGKRELGAHFRSIMEAVCVDAAANETKSARLMQRLPADQPLAPNLKALLRDRAHASRRLISRPWAADENVKALTDEVVMGRHSLIQRIHHSTMFTAWYKRNTRDANGVLVATSKLGAAKHRFESRARPLAQFILTLPAIIKTAEEIVVLRVGEEAHDAAKFLKTLTAERVLLLAMLSDAADESLVLTRIFDEEGVDIAAQLTIIENFQQRIHALFMDGKCFQLPGFTSAACAMLEKGCFMRTGRHLRQLGGPGSLTVEIKDRCLRHLRHWVAVCDTVVKSEFPDFDIVAALRVFDLARSTTLGGREGNTLPAESGAYLKRLANVFGEDLEQLRREYARCLPAALAQVKRTQCGNREAWTTAVQSSASQAQPMRALKAILQRYLGWTMSTSGVEQSWACVRRLLAHRALAQEDTELRLLVLATPLPPEVEINTIVGRAQEHWCLNYGASRAGSQHATRGATGNRRHQASRVEGPSTFVGFLSERRKAVKAAAADSAQVGDTALPDDLPEGLREEAAHQKRRLTERRAEAIVIGQMDVEEVSPEELRAAEDRQLHQLKGDTADARRHDNLRRSARPVAPSRESLLAARCYVVRNDDDDTRQVLGMLQHATDDVVQADVVVAPSVVLARLPPKIQLVLCIAGGFLVTPAFFVKDQKVCLKLKRIAQTPRQVFPTAAFRAAHANLLQVLIAVTARRGCRSMKVVMDQDRFVEAFERAAPAQRKSGFLILKAKTDGNVVPGVTQVRFWEFLARVQRTDAQQTVGGC